MTQLSFSKSTGAKSCRRSRRITSEWGWHKWGVLTHSAQQGKGLCPSCQPRADSPSHLPCAGWVGHGAAAFAQRLALEHPRGPSSPTSLQPCDSSGPQCIWVPSGRGGESRLAGSRGSRVAAALCVRLAKSFSRERLQGNQQLDAKTCERCSDRKETLVFMLRGSMEHWTSCQLDSASCALSVCRGC